MSDYSPRFTAFMRFIFKWECVYRRGVVVFENEPNDPGGVTKYGVDQRSHPKLDIKNLTEIQALAVYWEEWGQHQCDSLPQWLGEVYFNACVNCGAARANTFVNREPHTAEVFLDSQEDFYRRLVAHRRQQRADHSRDAGWLKEHPDLSGFLRGWLNRTGDLRRWISVKPI